MTDTSQDSSDQEEEDEGIGYRRPPKQYRSAFTNMIWPACRLRRATGSILAFLQSLQKTPPFRSVSGG